MGRVVHLVRTAAGPAEPVSLPAAAIEVKNLATGKINKAVPDAEGIFRIRGLAPGNYEVSAALPGYKPLFRSGVQLKASEVLLLELTLTGERRTPAPATEPPSQESPPPSTEGEYRELQRRPAEESEQPPIELAPESKIATPRPDRWNLPLPGWERYDRSGEYPYVLGHWYDPFNQNKIKGDKPIFGERTLFNFTGTSVSAFDGRRLYIPSGISAAHPEESVFFGSGRQLFLAETVRLSFDLFHGDTSFRPVDWRIRITPAFNVNQIWTAERGIVNIDVRKGT